MTKPDLIIFDCDGVLVDSEVLSCRCLSEALAGYDINLGLDQALDLFLGRNLTAVLEHYEALGRSIRSNSRPSCGQGSVPRFSPRFARLKG